MKANRQAYGEALNEIFSSHPNLVALDADLAMATYSDYFRREHPNSFIECGIAEQNMMAVAAGLATVGFIPFVSTFAVFASLRAAEQFRNSICYPHLNVKVVGTHAGIECGQDGATHQALEDLAVMRAMAGNVVLAPADPIATKALVKKMAEYDGPCYMRIGRDAVSQIYDDSSDFSIGGSHKLRDGHSGAIIACGDRVHCALEAADVLAKDGIDLEVLDLYSLKPLDEKAVLEAANTGVIFTIEDHHKAGGLYSAVCECICATKPCRVIGMGMDSFGRSGPSSELFEYYGLDTGAVVQKVLSVLRG